MIWNDIPGWEERYLISEFGDVKSKDMIVSAKSGFIATRKGRNLKLIKKNNGYYCVTLTNGIDRPQVSVHRLVARTFIGECPLGLHVLHSDGDKSNNHYSNLRYGTPADNHADTLAHGHRLLGVDNPTSKLDDDKVRYIRESDESALNLAVKFNVCKGHIYQIKKNKVWKHVF